MKTKFFLLLLFSTMLNTFCQEGTQIFVGKIIEFQTTTPISGAHVYNLNRLNGTTSRENGIFEIPVTINDTLIISHVKYKTQRIVVNENYLNHSLPIIIYFEIMTNYLDIVTIKNHNLSGVLEKDSKSLPRNTNKDSINDLWQDQANNPSFKDYERNLEKPLLNNVDPTGNSTVRVSTGIPMKFKDIEIRKELKNKRYFPQRIISDLGNTYFTKTLKIPSEKVHHFLTYCDSRNIIELYYKNELMKVLTILQEESVEYIKIKE